MDLQRPEGGQVELQLTSEEGEDPLSRLDAEADQHVGNTVGESGKLGVGDLLAVARLRIGDKRSRSSMPREVVLVGSNMSHVDAAVGFSAWQRETGRLPVPIAAFGVVVHAVVWGGS
jgi:hypothetical protein